MTDDKDGSAAARARLIEQEMGAWLEPVVEELPESLTRPGPGECVICYLWRMQDFGCRGHEFTDLYAKLSGPGATGLKAHLRRMGAVCCECEVFSNAYQPAHLPRSWTEETFEDEWEQRMAETADMPACLGVRRGSIHPCGLWIRS